MFIMISFACGVLVLVFPNNCPDMFVSFPGKFNIVVSPGAFPERGREQPDLGAPYRKRIPHTDER